jgi:hypothetical protein
MAFGLWWRFQRLLSSRDREVDARIWTLGEVIAYEPSLAFILDLPPSRIVARRTVEAPWRVVKVGLSNTPTAKR